MQGLEVWGKVIIQKKESEGSMKWKPAGSETAFVIFESIF